MYMQSTSVYGNCIVYTGPILMDSQYIHGSVELTMVNEIFYWSRFNTLAAVSLQSAQVCLAEVSLMDNATQELMNGDDLLISNFTISFAAELLANHQYLIEVIACNRAGNETSHGSLISK